MSEPILSNIGNPDKYSIRLTQTSKGVWYCERVEVNESASLFCLKVAEDMAKDINAMLKRINQV